MSIRSLYPDIRPSLLLDFTNARQLDPRITFTRNSTATYVGRDGLIKTAGLNQPRFDHDPVTLESLGLLIEESRTNLLPYSVDLTQGVWTKAYLTVVFSSTEVAPDGTTGNVIIATANTDNNGHYSYYTTQNSGRICTTSAWFKNQSTTTYFPQLRVFGIGSGQAYATFNLSGNGSIPESGGAIYTSSSITPYPNGWYRCTMTFDTTAAGNSYLGGYVVSNSTSSGELPSYAGSASTADGFLVWGFQNETGSFVTSYIPTSGSTVTRVEDTGNITGESFSSWFNQTEGTYLVRAKPIEPHNATTPPYFFIFESGNSGDFSNTISIGKDNTDNYRFRSLKFSNLSDTSVAYTTNQFTAAVSGSGTNDGVAVLNGSVVATSTGSAPGTQNHNVLCIGDRFGGTTTGHYNGTISKLVYYPKRLTNDQLQTLTK